MNKNHAEIERIFSQAADLRDVSERAAFLDAACGQDQLLRAAVERLLKHDAEVSSFLDTAAVDFPIAPTIDQPAPNSPALTSAPTSWWRRSAKVAWGRSTWLRRRNQSAAKSP
jgi:hypothetical protein